MRLTTTFALSVVSVVTLLGACAKGKPGPHCADFIAKLDTLCSDSTVASIVGSQCRQAKDLIGAGASQAEWDQAESLCASQVSGLDRALPMIGKDLDLPAELAAAAPPKGEPGPACGALKAAIAKRCTTPSTSLGPVCEAFSNAWRGFEKAAGIGGWAQVEDVCTSQADTINSALAAVEKL